MIDKVLVCLQALNNGHSAVRILLTVAIPIRKRRHFGGKEIPNVFNALSGL